MWTRRRFLARGLTLAGLAAGAPRLLAVPKDNLPDGNASKGMITADTQKAIDQGLAYLVSNQRTDGSWGTGGQQGNVAITSLGALALMAGGHQPGRGKYGKQVTGALEYVLGTKQTNPLGYLKNGGAFNGLHGPMYGHGFATLFLGEVAGMVPKKELRAKVRETLKQAVELIVKTQNKEGGWRYHAQQEVIADLSVTICEIMALRSARNAGISVPKSTAVNCVKYVKACQNPDGGFRYTRFGGPSAFARSAAGVAALYSAGVYKGKEVAKGLNYLMQFKPGTNHNGNFAAIREYQMHYYYGQYYAVQAMWTAGDKYWKEWFPAIRDELLGKKQGDGSWYDRICTHYGTAMSCIILQVPNNYLPILQK